MIKKLSIIALSALAILGFLSQADAQVTNSQWKLIPTSTISTVIPTYKVQVPELGSPGNPCVDVNASGTLATTTCGSGGGGGGLASGTPFTLGNLTYASSSSVLATYLGSLCGGGQFVTGVSASGTAICSTPAGSGNVSSATNTVNNYFPFWNGSNQLSATSSLQESGLTLLQGGAFNATGTITQNGTAVALQTITISSGGILSGGGDLSSNRTISLSTSSLWGYFTTSSPITFNPTTGVIGCATCLTGNQTITLTGDVTGSGATSIATTYTTSTLYLKFSGVAPITFNTSTGAIGWTNSLGYITTSTNLTVANFASANISQWTNNSNFITFASSGTWTAAITHTATTTFQSSTLFTFATSSILVTNASGSVGNYTATSCAAGTAYTGLSATGTPTCTSYAPSTTIPTAYGTVTTGTANTAPDVAVGLGGTAIGFYPGLTFTSSTGALAAPTGTFSGIVNVASTLNASTTLNVTGASNLNGTTTIGTGTTTLVFFGNVGHWDATGTIPALSSCGTTPTSTGSDYVGKITVGSVSATACTMTFVNAFVNPPTCIVTNRSMSVVNAMTYAVTTSTLTVSQTGLTGDVLDYICHAVDE